MPFQSGPHPSGLGLVPARTVAWLRLILVGTAMGACVLFAVDLPQASPLFPWQVGVVSGALFISLLLLILAPWFQKRWQIALHLVFDIVWLGALIWLTGANSSPAIPLLFAVILIGNQALPGAAPFVLPSVAGLVLALIASLYLAGTHPLPEGLLAVESRLIEPHAILGQLALQVTALFLVDGLGQILARRLQEQHIFTQELLDQLGEGVLAVDRQDRIAYANEKVRRLFDMPASVVGRPLAQVLADQALAEVRSWLQAGLGPQVERIVLHDRHLVCRIDELRDRYGRLIGRTLLVADVTRLKDLEANAQRAEHLAGLGRMSAGIAHEIRNPLTSLRGCAQELAEIHQRSADPDAANMANIIVNEADRLARIVNDFLALSRQREPMIKPLDLEPVLAQIQTLAQGRRDMPIGLVVEANTSDDCPMILGDADHVRQILMNLVNNAIDACRESPTPRITIEARSEDAGRLARIQVTDTGCGIPASQHEQIFTPFFSTKAQGTGLGLSLVAHLVRDLGGAILVASQPGKGTRIAIDFPAVPGSGPDQAPPPSP